MRRFTLVLALLLVLGACGDDDGLDFGGLSTTSSVAVPIPSFTTTTAAPSTTAAPATTQPVATTEPGSDLPELPPGPAYTGYELYSNGVIEVEVPVEWFDHFDGAFTIGDTPVGTALAASPDHDGLINRFDTPGVFIGATTDPEITSDVLFGIKQFNNSCTYGGRDTYDDGEYVGHFETWNDCQGSLSDFIVIVAQPTGGGAVILVEITLVTEADFEALNHVLQSWRLIGNP